MNPIISLRSELLKTKNTASVYLCFGVAAIIPLMTFIFEYDTPKTIQQLRADPWNVYFTNGSQMLSILFLPAVAVLICTLIPQIEYKNNSWKQLMTTPQPKATVFFSKYAAVLIYLLVFMIAYNLMMAVSLMAMGLFRHDLALFTGNSAWAGLLLLNGKLLVSVMGITAIQFWLGLRFRNFIVPIGVGVAMWIVAALLFEYHATWIHLFPYANPIQAVLSKYKNIGTQLAFTSAVYAVVFLLIGFADFRQRRFQA